MMMAKEKKPRKAKATWTKPTQFRLSPDAIADLDAIAEYHARKTGVDMTRSDAVRIALHAEAERIRKREEKSS